MANKRQRKKIAKRQSQHTLQHGIKSQSHFYNQIDLYCETDNQEMLEEATSQINSIWQSSLYQTDKRILTVQPYTLRKLASGQIKTQIESWLRPYFNDEAKDNITRAITHFNKIFEKRLVHVQSVEDMFAVAKNTWKEIRFAKSPKKREDITLAGLIQYVYYGDQ